MKELLLILNKNIENYSQEELRSFIINKDMWELSKVWFDLEKANQLKILNCLTDRTKEFIVNKATEYKDAILEEEEIINSINYLLELQDNE